jgi:hypothetical protein
MSSTQPPHDDAPELASAQPATPEPGRMPSKRTPTKRLVAVGATHGVMLLLFAVPEALLVRQAWRDQVRTASAWALRLAFTAMFIAPYAVYAALTTALVIWLLRRPRTVVGTHLVLGLVMCVALLRYVRRRF